MGTRRSIAPRRGFRLRVHIATLFVALVASAGAALVGYGYVATSHLLLAAGDEEFLHVAERTAGHVRDLLAPAHLLVQLLARHRLTDTATLGARLESLPLLTAALAEHPEISAIFVGFAGGDFFLIRSLPDAIRQSLGGPPDAVFLVQSRGHGGGAEAGRYLFLDARLGTVRDEPRPDYRFDPRTRIWYAQGLRSDTPVRTSPYVFFTTREVGTTIAQRSADGRSVVGVDITLQDLSRRLARSRVTPSARMALVDAQGLVIAHPDSSQLVRAAPGGGPHVTRIGDLGDAALGPLFAAEVPASGELSLQVGGRAWIGMKRPIAAHAGDPLILLLAAPRAELVAQARGLAQRQLVIGVIVLGLTLGLVWFFARRISRPLEDVTRSVAEMGRGNLDAALPEIWNPVEVGSLIEATNRMRVQLKDHIEERATRLADEQRRAHELEIARQIQRSMLPAPLPEPLDGRYLIAAVLRPAREVGGDLYDFFVLEGHRLLFIVADVTDKGIPAALLMARVTGLFRAIGRSGAGPDGILRELDSRLSEGNDACMFVTAACGEVDGETGEIRYASAGHERPVLRRRDDSAVVLELEGGPALGLAVNLPFPLWIGHLAPGDALVLCTDGVTEAFDARGAAFGLDGFCRIVDGTPAAAIGALPDRVAEAVGHFAEGGGPLDDLAVLAVQYRPNDVEMLDGDAWRWAIAPGPVGAAMARRRVQAILRARPVPAAIVHDCARAAEAALARDVRPEDGGGSAGEMRVEVLVLPSEVRLRFEAGRPGRELLARNVSEVRRFAERCDYTRDGEVGVLTACWSVPAGHAEPSFKEAS